MLEQRQAGPKAVIALTGGAASGKTQISEAMGLHGVPIVDTDVLAREIVAPGSPTLTAIAGRFGHNLIGADGQLDRRALRDRILVDSSARMDLQALTHPAIRALARSRLAALTSPYALLVVPLLIESSGYDWVSRVLVVVADRAIRLQRLMQRDSVSQDSAERLLAAQTDDVQRLRLADDVLTNNGTTEELMQQVRALTAFYDALYGQCQG